MLPSSDARRETPTLLGPLARANLRHLRDQTECIPPLIQKRKQNQFQKLVVSSYLEFRTKDKFLIPSDSVCYTPSSEHFQFHHYPRYIF
jgi:hypothetical protein